MSLKLIQGFYLEEIHRGKANLGPSDQKRKSVFLYHCSMFSYHCSIFFIYCSIFSTAEQKMEQCVFVPLLHVFVTLFRFFCSTVPFFFTRNNGTVCFLHYFSVYSIRDDGTKWNRVSFNCCSVFSYGNNGTKTEQCILYHCSVFLYLCSVFLLLFRFFHQQNSVFVPLFRVFVLLCFLHCCSVFSTAEKKQNSESLYYCSVFSYHWSVFCTAVPFFPQQNKFRTVCSCTTVPCFCTTVLFLYH